MAKLAHKILFPRLLSKHAVRFEINNLIIPLRPPAVNFLFSAQLFSRIKVLQFPFHKAGAATNYLRTVLIELAILTIVTISNKMHTLLIIKFDRF